jgi:uncharacterized protein (TIGR02453 family)
MSHGRSYPRSWVPWAMAFSGFPVEGLDFLEGLEADNSKSYWTEHREVYDSSLKGPMEALIGEVDARFRPLRMFRPHRDVRFSKDKSPYKTNIAAAGERQGGTVYYVHLSSAGLLVGGGAYMLAVDQIARFRAAIADDRSGGEFLKLVDHFAKAKGAVLNSGGDAPLKTAPKGYAREHPRIEYLRWKGAAVFHEFGTPKWLHTVAAKSKIEAAWTACDPLNEWLDRHVGPSEVPPDQRR